VGKPAASDRDEEGEDGRVGEQHREDREDLGVLQPRRANRSAAARRTVAPRRATVQVQPAPALGAFRTSHNRLELE
jgi:hypothetical protein